MVKREPIQFSKIIGIVTGALFVLQVVVANIYAALKIDVTHTWYLAPIIGTVFATWFVSYANKEKPANIFKLRAAYTDKMIERAKTYEDKLNIVNKEIEKSEELFDDYADSKATEALHEETDIQTM